MQTPTPHLKIINLKSSPWKILYPSKRYFLIWKSSFSVASSPLKILYPSKRYFLIWKSSFSVTSSLLAPFKKTCGRDAFSLRKTAIFMKIAPIQKMVNAQRVFLKENGHFHEDRPHRTYRCSLFSVKSTNDRFYWPKWVVQKFFRGVSGGVSRGVSRWVTHAHYMHHDVHFGQ